MSRPWQENTGLLALRAGVGGVLVAHGVQKLFGWLGGRGLKDTGATFEQMGFTPGLPSAVAAGMGEAGGGLLIMVGLATPAAGAAAVGTMIPAAAVLAPSGFFATRGGYEYPALLGVSAAALALTGPGDWSLDACLGYRLNPPWAAPAALLAFSAASLVILQRRRKLLAARSATDPSQIGDDDAATPARRSSSDPPHRAAKAEPLVQHRRAAAVRGPGNETPGARRTTARIAIRSRTLTRHASGSRVCPPLAVARAACSSSQIRLATSGASSP